MSNTISDPKTFIEGYRAQTPEKRKEIDRELSKALARIMMTKVIVAVGLALLGRWVDKKLDES